MLEELPITVVAGTVVKFSAVFTDATSGLPADPTVIAVGWQCGATTGNAIYGVGGVIQRTDVGLYYANIDTTGMVATGSNNLTVQFAGQGNVQVVNSMVVIVEAPPIVPVF